MIPSNQESVDAIIGARRALSAYRGNFWFGNLAKVEREFNELDLLTRSERFMALDIALGEITPADRLGPEPPNDFSVHPPFHNEKLYAFCWYSKEFKRRMYLKFALAAGCRPSKLVLYSFHEAKY
jgi:hypothetical protein